MPTPAPSVDENASPIYGIRTPKVNARAYLLGTLLGHTADDIETVLQEFGIPPVLQGNTFVATSDANRNAYFGTPATAAARRLLQDTGAQCVRPDKGWTEQYYAGMTDGGANPGGVTTAGWYPLPGTVAPTKLAIASSPAVGTGDLIISWASALSLLPGVWASSPNPSRLVLPIIGFWEVTLTARGTSMDTRLLSSAICRNGETRSAAGDLADGGFAQSGTSGITDPFAKVTRMVEATAVTDYVEAKAQANSAGGSLTAGTARIAAKYIGPRRG